MAYQSFVAPVLTKLAECAENITQASAMLGRAPDDEDMEALRSLMRESNGILEAYRDALLRNIGYTISVEFPGIINVAFEVSQEEHGAPAITVIPLSGDGSDIGRDEAVNILLAQLETMADNFANNSLPPHMVFDLFDGYEVRYDGVIKAPCRPVSRMAA